MRQGIKEKDIRDLQKCFEKMDNIVRRIQSYNPNAHIIIIESDTIALTGKQDAEVNNEFVVEQYIPKMDTINMA